MVGDSPADMEAGRRAGVKICAVTYGYDATAEFEKWQPTTGFPICANFWRNRLHTPPRFL